MRGATRGGWTRVRLAGLVFRVAFRSHRSRPFALLASWPTTEVPGNGSRRTASLGIRTPTDNGNPRRNDDPPILWVSGALPPSPQQGTAPPAPPLYVWTVSPRGTPPRPPAYLGVPGRSRCGRSGG